MQISVLRQIINDTVLVDQELAAWVQQGRDRDVAIRLSTTAQPVFPDDVSAALAADREPARVEIHDAEGEVVVVDPEGNVLAV